MTEDRIFKNKVKEVAELNGLTYTEAKKAVIELNKRIEEESKNPESIVNQYLKELTVEYTAEMDISFPLDSALFVEPFEEHFFKIKRINPEKDENDFFELTNKRTLRNIDFLPLNNKVRIVEYTNVIRSNRFYTDKKTAKKMYFSLVKHFTPENSYFIEGPNSTVFLKKVVQALKKHKETDRILVGLIGGLTEIEASENFTKLKQELADLAETKDICIVSNILFKQDDMSLALDVDDVEIEYYPFDKLHGGSYHRSTNKTILGHLKGETQFVPPRITLIEKDDHSCIEKIYELNKGKAKFSHWKTKEEMTEFIDENEILDQNLFIKIDFEMDSDDLRLFLKSMDRLRFYYESENKDKGQIVVETPDAELIQSHYHDESEKLVNFTTKYSLIDRKLYSITGDEISLYKV